VRKLKDIKGQKSPKLSDRRHPKPTIKKLIEENRGNYQILHRPQKKSDDQNKIEKIETLDFSKKIKIDFCFEPERKNKIEKNKDNKN